MKSNRKSRSIPGLMANARDKSIRMWILKGAISNLRRLAYGKYEAHKELLSLVKEVEKVFEARFYFDYALERARILSTYAKRISR